MQAASEAAGKPMEGFFRRHITSTAALPLAEALRIAGLEMRSEVMELPEAMTVLGDLLRSPSVTVTPEGLRVNASNSESLHAGDTIVGVEGAPVRTFEALRRAFKDRGRASKVRLSIVRDGAPTDIEVTLAGATGEPVATSRHAEVSIAPLAGAEPSAVAIRASLLGRPPEAAMWRSHNQEPLQATNGVSPSVPRPCHRPRRPCPRARHRHHRP